MSTSGGGMLHNLMHGHQSSSTTSTSTAPGQAQGSGQSSTQSSPAGSAELSMMAAVLFPTLTNRSTDDNDAARAVQIALMIQKQTGIQEQAQQQEEQKQAEQAKQLSATAAGQIAQQADQILAALNSGDSAKAIQLTQALKQEADTAAQKQVQAAGAGQAGSQAPAPASQESSSTKQTGSTHHR